MFKFFKSLNYKSHKINVDILSIHIPKTAGRSFYNILEQVYGTALSISYKRKDVLLSLKESPTLAASIDTHIKVIHGHLYYKELQEIHHNTNARVICWLRNPVDRVVSNYHFFIRGLKNPLRNPVGYATNKHRINETLIEYASRDENRNRMSKFLKGISTDELFFVGMQEYFEQDIMRLGRMLDWPDITIPVINKSPNRNDQKILSAQTRKIIEDLNVLDLQLYKSVMERRN